LFFSCRKYLLRSLYHDLQDLSSEKVVPSQAELGSSTRPVTNVQSGIELATLPSPSTHSTSSAGKSRSLHSSVARTIFSVCFSESCVMFFFLLCQGLDLFDSRTRLFNWKASLFLLLATNLVFTPISASLVVTLAPKPDSNQRLRRQTQIIMSLVPVVLYLFALSYIPLPSALSSSDTLTTALSRLIVLGTALLGLLSGFGAVSNAWAFFPLFARTRIEPTDSDVISAEQALVRIQKDLQDKKESHRRANSQPQGEGTWFSRVVPSLRGDDDIQELKGLEALEYQMNRNVNSLRQQRQNARFSGTLKGKLLNWSGRVFALYCIFRVISSVINILIPVSQDTSSRPTTPPDVITHVLAYILSLLSPTEVKFEEVARIGRQISLALVGVIIITSLRLVLRGVTRALRVPNRTLGASLMLLILAQLMGIYFLSTLVQLRSLFPPPDTDSSTVNLFSTIPKYEVFGSLFDYSFLLAAGSSAFVRWFGERVNGAQQAGS